jgi:hypothetical protein
MIDVSEDSYPDCSKIRASWPETERVLEMLRQNEGLMSGLNDLLVCGIAPLQPNPYRSFDLCVMQNAEMGPLAYIFRPTTAINPIYFPRQFERDLALKILEIVAPAPGTEPLRKWVIWWPKNKTERDEDFRDVLPFPLVS